MSDSICGLDVVHSFRDCAGSMSDDPFEIDGFAREPWCLPIKDRLSGRLLTRWQAGAVRRASTGLDGGQGGQGELDHEIPQPVWTAVETHPSRHMIDPFQSVSSVVDAI